MTSLRAVMEGLTHEWKGPETDVDVRGLACDSRRVKPGDFFVAIKGQKHDGHEHIADVVRAGAAAVLVEKSVASSLPVIRVPSTTAALSPVAARMYGHPSRRLRVAGVTGTNGKTTVTYLLEHLLLRAGRRPGVIGTIDYRWPGRVEKAVNTTPQAADVQRLLAAMREDGVTDVAMEVSSHSLALRRVEDVTFRVGVFTNLTRDHLDFHRDMESYFRAKAHLFDLLGPAPAADGPDERRAIVNRDDPWAPRLLESLHIPVWTYAVDGPADLCAEEPSLAADGSRFRLDSPAGAERIHLQLVGRHNVYNALAAAGAALALGVPFDVLREGLKTVTGVPGRLERVTELDPGDAPKMSRVSFSVFVDYAHTDDALKNVLTTLRPLTKGMLLVVFGCGGDRDKTKRPLMGEAAARLADRVTVTSDNPRSEDPAEIAREVAAGVLSVPGKPFDVVLDRSEAIARALAMAEPGDVVLIAGKGHETTQIFADRTVEFDDRAEARRLLKEKVLL